LSARQQQNVSAVPLSSFLPGSLPYKKENYSVKDSDILAAPLGCTRKHKQKHQVFQLGFRNFRRRKIRNTI
jgi:hypothetical protein